MPFKTFTSVVLPASDVNTYLLQQAIIRCTSTTRPGSPAEGWHIWETDTQRRYVFRNGAWTRYGYPEYIYALKSESQSQKYPSNVLQNPVADSDLKITLDANSMYWLESFIMISSSDFSSPGFGQQLAAFYLPDNAEALISEWAPEYLNFLSAPPPNVEEMALGTNCYNQTGVTGPHNRIPSTAWFTPATSSDTAEFVVMEPYGVIQTQDAGDLQFLWTPFQAGTMTVYQNSWIGVRKLLV
jgi:hypothetical protein